MHDDRDSKFRLEMIAYIREHFRDVLGDHVELLEEDDGLDRLQALLREGRLGRNV